MLWILAFTRPDELLPERIADLVGQGSKTRMWLVCSLITLGFTEDDTFIAQCLYRNYSFAMFAVTHLEFLLNSLLREIQICIFVCCSHENLTYTGPPSPHTSSLAPLFCLVLEFYLKGFSISKSLIYSVWLCPGILVVTFRIWQLQRLKSPWINMDKQALSSFSWMPWKSPVFYFYHALNCY